MPWLDGTIPTVVSRPGQTATIEIIREIIAKEGDEWVRDKIGLVVTTTSEFYGLSDQSHLAIKYTLPPDPEDQAVYERTGKIEDLKLHTYRYSGENLTRGLGGGVEATPAEITLTDDDGGEIPLTLAVERIDATERRIEIE